MPFLFSHICDLFSTLEGLHIGNKTHSEHELQALYKSHLTSWFGYFRPDLTPDLWLPVFSILWPEGRKDRVYGFKEDGLLNAISTTMCFGKTRADELKGWRTLRGDRDLGECVERVFAMGENIVSPAHAVTVAQVEEVLNGLASKCRFSSNELQRARPCSSAVKDDNARQALLGRIYRRLHSRDAKWFTRIILKSLLPVNIEPDLAFGKFHFLLPEIWQVRNDLKSALNLLSSKTFKLFPPQPIPEDREELREAGWRLLRPEMGIKVGRPVFVKGQSCEGVLKTVGKGSWAMERKYDGEYCQIHVDLTRGRDWLTIYSKSGRDSTQDRAGCHSLIRQCLQLDCAASRKIKQRCILEAEFLVYSQEDEQIAGFHTIKNHVQRAGKYIGTTAKSLAASFGQHIMLKFFDCILLDDTCTPVSSYNARRHHLETVVKRIPNRAELVTRKVIDFSAPGARELFFETFAEGMGLKWEGFVMKPCEGNYVGWGQGRGNYWIKLKKDYIGGLGDSGDFAIVGGRVGGKRGVERGIDPGVANTFYAACLTNKHDVVSLSAKPIFKIIFTVSYNLTKDDIRYLKAHKYFHGVTYSEVSKTSYDLTPLDSHFEEPDFLFSRVPVMECFGGGFDKIDASDYWTLRWPRCKKIHKDRDYLEALTFDELQAMGECAANVSSNCIKDIKQWEEKLTSSTLRRRRTRWQTQTMAEKPTGLLERSFWEADSPTTKRLVDRIWLPEKSQLGVSEMQEVEEESPSVRGKKRPLSQISGNCPSQPQEDTQKEEPEKTAAIVKNPKPPRCPIKPVSKSPILRGNVYVSIPLANDTEIGRLCAHLKITKRGTCKDLLVSISKKEIDERAVLLVEERDRCAVKGIVSELTKATGQTDSDAMIEVYSWRILKKMEKIREEKEGGGKRRKLDDWSLLHLDTISPC